MHVKHLAHSSAAVVLEKSSHAPAKSNSYVGLAMLALSGSLLPTGLPEMGSRVRPLLLTAPDLGALKKRLPVRELSVASMMAVKRPMTMGSEKKTSRSAAASGPVKHVSSMHLTTQVCKHARWCRPERIATLSSIGVLWEQEASMCACACLNLWSHSSCSFQPLGLK